MSAEAVQKYVDGLNNLIQNHSRKIANALVAHWFKEQVTTREGARAEYTLPVWSERIGLIGKCDVVEFWPDGNIYPVEYKHGERKKRLNDDLQLVAQALCLEEMTGKTILHGAIYHHGSRRRREVAITQELRDKVEETVYAIRAMIDSGKLPPPANDARCKECSLKEICQPDALAERHRLKFLREELFSVADLMK